MLKKGQAAMEFLMTYGWAILVVLIAIGALAYFGVLNPSRFLPESCTIGPGISCDEFQIKDTVGEDATFVIRNGMGNTITAVGLTLTPDTGSSGAWAVASNSCSNTIADGQQCTFLLDTTTTPGTLGTKFKGTLTFTYTLNGVTHNKAGAVTTKVEA